VAAKYDLPYVKPYVYLNLANLYRSSSEIHETTDFNDTILNYYRKAYYAAYEVQDWKAFVVMFYGLGYFAFKTGETKAIDKETDLFLRTAVPKDVHLVRFCRHYCSAIRCYQAKDYKGTLRYFDLMLANNDASYTPERYTIMTNEGKALLLWRMKRSDEAIACLKTAERIALEHGTRDLQVDVYRNLYKFYTALDRKDLAWRYQLIYFQKKDSLMNFSKMQTVGEMRFLDQLHKVNDTVKNLSEERLIQRIVIGVILVVTLVIAAFLLLLIRNYRRLQSDHRQLYRKNVETLRREDAEKHMIEWYEQRLAAVGTPESLPQTPKARHNASGHTGDDDGAMRLRINKVMENTDEICAPTFSLNQLADLLNMKYWNISHAINEIYGKNFNALLNEYRIKEACRRLGDIEKYGNYTIEAIALGVGFKSRSNFVTTFKNITGLTPSEYLNMAKSSI
jgi:AraC-like DNA-binding protein